MSDTSFIFYTKESPKLIFVIKEIHLGPYPYGVTIYVPIFNFDIRPRLIPYDIP